jgi:DNA end-binding protein Ku
MKEAGVVGLAQVVLSGREQLVVVRPSDDMLTMSVLHYAKKIKGMELFAEELAEQQETTAEERKLTNTLIEASSLEEFDIGDFEDDYVENLGRLIQMKVDGQEIVEAPDREEPKIINLMEALKKSVAEAQAAGTRKMAPSIKSKTAAKKSTKKTAKKGSSKKKKTG